MKLFHHITVLAISENERASFAEIGIRFKEVTRGPQGECVIFEIGEDDPRWEKVNALVNSLEDADMVPKKYRVQDISMTAPTWEENMQQMTERVAVDVDANSGFAWLEGYSGQTVDELLALEGRYRIDSLVLAFEEAISNKTALNKIDSLTNEEQTVLAVEMLEREVNNGGYDQFFLNSSREFVPIVVECLRRIGCPKIADITQEAVDALGISDLSDENIEAAMANLEGQRAEMLGQCDALYYETSEPIAERLFGYIKANKAAIKI